MMNYLSQESQGSRNVGFIELDARNYVNSFYGVFRKIVGLLEWNANKKP